jgi:fibronectin type 3 domain-containing protein
LAPSAAAAGYDPSGVRVTWTVPFNNGWTINYYIIYRSTVSGGETAYAAVLPTTSYIDLNTTRGVTYYYRVAAVNAIGVGTLSAEVHASAH